MRPIITQWASSDPDYIATNQAFSIGVPLVLSNAIPSQALGSNGQTAFDGDPIYQNNLSLIFNNAATGVPNINLSTMSTHVDLPPGQARTISVTSTTSGIIVRIIGTNQYGTSLNVTVTTSFNVAVETTAYFTKIFSITPTNGSGASIQVGIGTAGYTSFPILDVYNKNALYTLSYSNLTEDAQVSPVYVTEPLMTFQNRVQVYTEFVPYVNIYALNVINNNVVLAYPGGIGNIPFTIPAATGQSLSISGIPLTSLGTYVTQCTGSFTQTIIQQGGRF